MTKPKTVYDVLFARYALHKKLKPREEALAQAIFASGKIRLDAEHEVNFTRLLSSEHQINLTFTQRELSDPAHAKDAYARLLAALLKRLDETKARALAAQYMERVQSDLHKRPQVSPQIELMMARALVCCNAYPVIALLHQEGAEIFISFGHAVGDVMDIARWQEVGKNSGLQAVGRGENAVYVSCGGHPFLTEKEFRHTGDGKPALARFMIIAAQETGHNGDMIRNEKGQWIGRHSAQNWQQAPSEKAQAGRRSDQKRLDALHQRCINLGLLRIAQWESHLEFYRKMHIYGWRRLSAFCLAKGGWFWLVVSLRRRRLKGVLKLQRTAYPCAQLEIFFSDMAFNLAPEAEVYRRKNLREEEAIACIEAVARVPQQVVKWGHAAVKCTTPALYRFYYRTVVPACEEALTK